MFARAQQSAGLFEVDVIRRADMNAGDVLIGGEFGERGVGAFEAKRFGCGAAAFGGAKHAAANRNAEAPERFEVGAANKTESNDGDGMIHERGSRWRDSKENEWAFYARREKASREIEVWRRFRSYLLFREEAGSYFLQFFFDFFVGVGEAEIQVVQSFDDSGGHDEARVPFVVCRNDVPGRELCCSVAN